MRNSRRPAILGCVIILAACAQRQVQPAETTVSAVPVAHGRILAARRFTLPKAGQLQLIVAALAMTDVLPAGTTPLESGPVPATEYIVREQGGRTRSVIQAGTSKLQAGDAVLIVPGQRPGEGARLLPDI